MGLISGLLTCFRNPKPRETNHPPSDSDSATERSPSPPSDSDSTAEKSPSDPNRTQPPSSTLKQLCHQFSLAEIQLATRNFKQSLIIGQGVTGSVYKGYVKNSSSSSTTPVAIKRRDTNSFYGLAEFKNEIVLHCQLRHPNLIPLIGFCYERKELVLVYEYMSNGSLHDHLHTRRNTHDPLTWKRRLLICIGTARALHYLHTGAKYAIVHRDIKTSNILLDENWEPKVSGLSLSKMGPLSTSKSLIRMDSRVMGTYGYAAPEYVVTGVLTEKSDVYSFGAVLFEVVTAMQAIELERGRHGQSWKSYAKKILDPFLKSKIAACCWKAFIDIVDRCLLLEGRERPDMGEVVVELEHVLQLQEEADANGVS